ncbi:hypothetical protein A3305_00100 [Rickettsia amblyommatis]|uniref:DnaA N-terminal domain-containing protein n=1 Tax=Rickettsia amblyommatis (strain GAT-30V) TaxID=1105111 RepID=H8K2G3_RICAG|nr:hypothetical protein [Rickettsia amblyommatis]AFC70005.1 hypothetical protein MCE_05815 [Rickettsia amblyommatis str. GAT-30V]ARD87057.1 hypothetical protein A3305_00100 [Rickettsia amblyommatis]KJV91089.1 dnaA N-terminal domain protein [Rickettsia amblyommatis str. Darkwater]
MHTICSSHFTSDCATRNFDDKNSIIFYNFVGNFIPPEWSNLLSHNGKILSKTARQLLSLIVFRLQIYYNNNIDELQETYHFFEEHLGVCQERVRQCLIELEKSGFIKFYKATIIKYGIKCRNTTCIKLARNFQPASSKIPPENEKNFAPTPKNFGVKPKEIWPQPQKSLDETIYIDNNKNISNKSRSSESTIFQNEKNIFNHNNQGQLQQQKRATNLQSKTASSTNDQQQADNTSLSSANITTGATRINTALQVVINKISKKYDSTPSNSNNSVINAVNHKSWFKRKKLTDFHPLTQEEADLLQIKSNREFNLTFINKLLLKLAEQYPEHHFGHKKVFLNYMAKALANELRETTQANCQQFQFKSSNVYKVQEQYLDKIESSNNTSRQVQLKRKIISVFDSDIAYELLSSCCFIGTIDNQYQIKLLKNIMLSENAQDKILQQVQMIYGRSIGKLKIIPFAELEEKQNNIEDEKQNYLLQLSKQLNPDSVWYKVRKFLIERYNQYIDFGVLSKLVVVEEDIVNKKVILKSTTAFNDCYVRNRHMQDLEETFKTQDYCFELIKFEYN